MNHSQQNHALLPFLKLKNNVFCGVLKAHFQISQWLKCFRALVLITRLFFFCLWNSKFIIVWNWNGKTVTVWKVSVLRVFPVRIFPHSDWIRRKLLKFSCYKRKLFKKLQNCTLCIIKRVFIWHCLLTFFRPSKVTEHVNSRVSGAEFRIK